MTNPTFHFIQISDPQFGMYRPGDDHYEETALVEMAVARINALAPDFVLCTGDLVDHPCSDRQMDHALDLFSGLNEAIPFLAVPGNHDVGDAPASGDLAWFRRRMGRDWFSFNHYGWHFIGLNSCLMAAPENAAVEADQQWAWLEDDLAGHAAEFSSRVVVFMHHPLFLKQATENEDYFNLPRQSRDRCVGLFGRHGVETVLAGHLHRCNVAADCELTVIGTGPVGMPLEDGFSGFRLFRTGGNGVEHQFFALDDTVGQENFTNR